MSNDILGRNEVEEDRLAALHEYCLLGSPADEELNAVVRVAAMVANVPNAALNLIDEDYQRQLTTVGFEGCDCARGDSMCAVQFRAGRVVQIPDAREHPLYHDNPWVTGRLANVRFYGSFPLISPEGYALGTLCVFDTEVGQLGREQINRLRDLADVVVALFERRRQARLVARGQRFTDAVLEIIDVGIAVSDKEGRLTLLNRAARQWHGIGDSSEHFSDRDGVAPIAEEAVPLRRALQGEIVNELEMVIRPPSPQREITLSVNGRRLVDDDGSTLGAMIAMTDVTLDRLCRRELKRAHSELAERGEQLAAAVVELRRSNEELEQFAGAVSHDLVRPMAAAHGFLELIGDVYGSTLDERGRDWIVKALRSVERMQQLVEALLTYARAGRSPVRPEPVVLAEVLRNVLADLQPTLEAARCEVTAGSELPTIKGDKTLVRQLVHNLIDNAVKYRSPDRECRITVAASLVPGRDRLASAGEWEITVADNGVGIPPSQRYRVFEMFAQLDPTAGKGHGIGLSTCQRIVERHHGTIGIRDTPGGGTTIVVTLPANR